MPHRGVRTPQEEPATRGLTCNRWLRSDLDRRGRLTWEHDLDRAQDRSSAGEQTSLLDLSGYGISTRIEKPRRARDAGWRSGFRAYPSESSRNKRSLPWPRCHSTDVLQWVPLWPVTFVTAVWSAGWQQSVTRLTAGPKGGDGDMRSSGDTAAQGLPRRSLRPGMVAGGSHRRLQAAWRRSAGQRPAAPQGC